MEKFLHLSLSVLDNVLYNTESCEVPCVGLDGGVKRLIGESWCCTDLPLFLLRRLFILSANSGLALRNCGASVQ